MKKNQKGFTVPLLIAIIAVLVIGCGSYVYKNKKIEVPVIETETQQLNQSQQQTSIQTLPISTQQNPTSNKPVSVDSTTETANQIAGWKTYTNTQYGFSFNYPNDWVFQKNVGNELVTLLNSVTDANFKKIIKEDAGKGFYYSQDLSVRYYSDFPAFLNEMRKLDSGYKNMTAKNLDDLVLNKKVEDFSKFTKVSIGGVSGYYGIWSAGITDDPTILLENNTGMYVILLTKDDTVRNNIISSFKFTPIALSLPATCVDQQGGMPVIISLSSNSGSVGTTVEVKGCNLDGFESDLNIWIKNSQGVKGILYSEPGSTFKLMKIVLKPQACQTDESYRGLPCGSYLNLVPGTYKIYTAPFGNKSNEATFTIK